MAIQMILTGRTWKEQRQRSGPLLKKWHLCLGTVAAETEEGLPSRVRCGTVPRPAEWARGMENCDYCPVCQRRHKNHYGMLGEIKRVNVQGAKVAYARITIDDINAQVIVSISIQEKCAAYAHARARGAASTTPKGPKHESGPAG